jgi:hypothetical protein
MVWLLFEAQSREAASSPNPQTGRIARCSRQRLVCGDPASRARGTARLGFSEGNNFMAMLIFINNIINIFSACENSMEKELQGVGLNSYSSHFWVMPNVRETLFSAPFGVCIDQS